MSIGIVKLRERRGGGGYVSYEVTLPKELVRLLGWRPGDRLLVELVEGEDGGKKLCLKRVEEA